jgi:dihydrofolate reductase
MGELITMEEVMRKIIESTLVSLDGVIGDPHLWAMNYFDNEAQEDSLEMLLASDAMLMGRRTYEIFAGVWPARTGDYADRMNNIRKYVFSSTLERADWNNSTIIRGDVAAEVAKLKQQDGQALVMYGHGPLGQTLLEHGLLDELRFSIHPILVGSGRLLFREGEKTILKLIAKKTRGTGVVVLSYQPAEP